MLISYKRKISKEQYDRAMANNGYIDKNDRCDIFSTAELCGYGVYSAMAGIDKDTGDYIVNFQMGNSCD